MATTPTTETQRKERTPTEGRETAPRDETAIGAEKRPEQAHEAYGQPPLGRLHQRHNSLR